MSAVVWAQPVATVPPPQLREQGLEYTHLWHGADGTTWDLNAWECGVYMQAGVTGLGHPAVDRWVDTSPVLPGNLFRGTRAQAKAVQWPVVITTCTCDGSWRDLARRWWKSWSTDAAGTWEVIDSSGRSVFLDLRLNPSGDFALDIDPGLQPWIPWMVDAVADFPYWRGEPIPESWGGPGDPEPFFDPTTGMLPLRIMLANQFATASLTNPGDVDTTVKFTAEGPLDAFSIKVGDGEYAGPAVADGDSIVMDSVQAVRNGTEEVSGLFTEFDPRPLPPGQDVPVTIITAGTGRISAEFTPLYQMGF